MAIRSLRGPGVELAGRVAGQQEGAVGRKGRAGGQELSPGAAATTPSLSMVATLGLLEKKRCCLWGAGHSRWATADAAG